MNANAQQPYHQQPPPERVVVVEQSSGLGPIVGVIILVVMIGFSCICCLIGALMMV